MDADWVQVGCVLLALFIGLCALAAGVARGEERKRDAADRKRMSAREVDAVLRAFPDDPEGF